MHIGCLPSWHTHHYMLEVIIVSELAMAIDAKCVQCAIIYIAQHVFGPANIQKDSLTMHVQLTTHQQSMPYKPCQLPAGAILLPPTCDNGSVCSPT